MAQAKQQLQKIQEEDNLPRQYHSKQSIFNNLFKIGKFNEERNPIDASLIIGVKYLLPLLVLGNTLPFSQHNSYLLITQKLVDYAIIYYPLIIFNKFLIVVTLVALYRQIFLLSSLVQEVIKIFRGKLRLLIEIDFHVSMLLLSLSVLPNLANAVLSFALYNFACIYLENYINKDDYFYCSSCKASFVGRLLITAGYILNAFVTGNANKGLIEIGILMFTISKVLWFYSFGCQLYPHILVKRGMIAFISLLITANQLILEKNLVGGSKQITAFFIRIALSFGLISLFFSYMSYTKCKATQQNINLLEIKDVLNHLFVNQSQLEDLVFIYGQMQMHRETCENLHCELHSFDLFRQRISLHQEQWGIRDVLKSYFRCLYESKMAKQDRHNELLDYLQYLFSQSSCNPFKMSLVLSQINLSCLDIFDRASLYDLKSSVEKLFRVQMKELYGGKLHFEEVILFESDCLHLQQMILFLVKSNTRIYEHLEQNEIDLNIVFERIRSNLLVEKDLLKCWGKLSQNMQHHRSMSAIYLYYKQLIKNETITRKDLLLLHPEKDAEDQQLYLSNFKQFDSSILFHKATMVFTCSLQKSKLLFKNFNLNFQNIIQYSKEELNSASIDKILTQQLTKVHQDSFESWLQGNLQSRYQSADFQVKNTECQAKDRSIIPVVKYFKAYLSSDSNPQFICLLKANKKPIIKAEDMNDYQDSKYDAQQKPLEMIEENCNEREILLLYNASDMQLLNKHAIFIKEKQFEPNPQSRDIFYFKVIIFAFFIIIAISLAVFHIVTVNNATILQEYTKQYIIFMQCYRIPMVLGNTYLQNIMMIGNQTQTAAQISQLSSNFTTLQSSSIVIETIFNPSINFPSNYSTYSADFLIANRSIQFDSIELFYVISSSIASLRAPVNKTSLDFLTFDQLITPAYDNMINGTKHKFHKSFKDFLNHIISTHLIIEAIQIAICIVFFTLMICKIRAFIKKMKLISDAIVYFKNEDLENIQNYWKNSHLMFRELFRIFKNEPAAKIRKIRSKTLKKRAQIIEQYMNRATKHIRQSKHFKNFRTITVLKVLIGTLILIGCLSGTQFSRADQFNYLVDFEQQGYLFLKYFPTATIAGYGCLSKYRSIHFPDETVFDFSRFVSSLEAMELVGKFSYIPEVQQSDSQYFQKQRNYFFGNPCTFNPKVLYAIGVTQTACETMVDGSFTRGLTSYMRVGSQRARAYMGGAKDMNSSQLSEFSTSVSVLSAYVLDAITTWGSEFHGLLDRLVQQQAALTLANFFVLATVVLVVFVFLFVGFLEREYELYRYMFMKMIPDYVLKADKVARQTFINFHILE